MAETGGTHGQKLSSEARARRRIKNDRNGARVPTGKIEAGLAMNASCRSYGCTHKKHGGKNKR